MPSRRSAQPWHRLRCGGIGYPAEVPAGLRVLVTNDDGVDSPGLHAVVRQLARLGHHVQVVAPGYDASGSSAAIGHLPVDGVVALADVDLPFAEDGARTIDGPPGLIAMLACLGGLGECPDLVVSGINAGLNTGHSVLHSGTVGAALTAHNFGVSSLAISLAPADQWHWHTACELVAPALEILAHAPGTTTLNVNVPGVPAHALLGLRWAELDRFGSVRAAVSASSRRKVQIEYRETGADLDPKSDTALVEAGYATVTAIVGIGAVSIDEPTPQLRGVERSVADAPSRAVRTDVPQPVRVEQPAGPRR